jgi:hypothetical protein
MRHPLLNTNDARTSDAPPPACAGRFASRATARLRPARGAREPRAGRETRSEAIAMSDPESTPSSDSVKVQRAQYVWEEYRYRHDLIWKLLFRMTAVAVLLAITPFTIKDLASESAEDWVKLLPAIALLLVAASAIVLRSELARFASINRTYEVVQEEAIGSRTGVEPAPKQATGKLKRWKPQRVFETVVRWYPIALFVMVFVAALVLWFEIGI